jgi:hypothetical protein
MITDSYFEQGVTHEVCEDYALHGQNYAIVCDGCSNGGGPRIDSDWGARLICKAAEEQVGEYDPSILLPAIGERAKSLMVGLPNLGPDCLTATMMMLQTFDDGVEPSFYALTVGDGVVGGRRKDGRWKIHVIEFPQGPFYLKYNIFGEEQKFFDSFGDQFKIGTYFGKLMTPEMEPPENPEFNLRNEEWRQFMSYSEKEFTLNPSEPYNIFEFPIEEYDFAFVCSDGIQSFYQPRIGPTRKYNESIHVLDAMRTVMDYVTIRPGFARLQRHWAFKQDRVGTLVRRGWKNSDDVSTGVIHA